MANQKSVCVFCGARSGALSAYEHDAQQLGQALAIEGWRLVYGAGDVGLMGIVAGAAQEANGDTLGVIPAHLATRELIRPDLGRLIVTEDMHERKMLMFRNSQAIVVLPGGVGSLDEFFEVLTWRQLGLHNKPIHVLNTEGYWDKLFQLVKHVITEGFADSSLQHYYSISDSVPALIAGLRKDLSLLSAASE